MVYFYLKFSLRSCFVRYTGDDFLEEYNPDSQHDEVEDRGDAYIFVKKDLRGLEPDKSLLDSLKGLIKETTGDGDLEEADDDRPEDEEDSVEEEVVEYREDLGPEDGKETFLQSLLRIWSALSTVSLLAPLFTIPNGIFS